MFGYPIKSKRGESCIRDGVTLKMQKITPRAWTFFQNLPRGMGSESTPVCEIRVICGQEDIAACEADNQRMALQDAKRPDAKQNQVLPPARIENETTPTVPQPKPEARGDNAANEPSAQAAKKHKRKV